MIDSSVAPTGATPKSTVTRNCAHKSPPCISTSIRQPRLQARRLVAVQHECVQLAVLDRLVCRACRRDVEVGHVKCARNLDLMQHDRPLYGQPRLQARRPRAGSYSSLRHDWIGRAYRRDTTNCMAMLHADTDSRDTPTTGSSLPSPAPGRRRT